MSAIRLRAQNFYDSARDYMPGILVSVIIALAAKFLSEHYGAPALLMALLLGIAFHFLTEEGKCQKGIDFAAKPILRLGVALLGARISVDLLIDLGPSIIALTILGVFITILCGLLLGRLFGFNWHFALLTGGAVAICGASAAMAIAAILPQQNHSERNLIFTVLGVTILSTLAMIFYPILIDYLGMSDRDVGVFLGATIHDVAQVVGAGFSVSEEAGETATLVKLIRVTMLAPVILIFSLVIRRQGFCDQNGQKPPLLPGFVIGFLILASVNSLGWMPASLAEIAMNISRWALLIAIAAVGMKTSIAKMLTVGPRAIGLLTTETLFLALFIIVGLFFLGSI